MAKRRGSGLPTGTVTFLFSDVEGSTRLLRRLGGDRYAKALADYQRLMREACTEPGGTEVDTQGDSFFFVFARAMDAAAAGAAAQRALAGHIWPDGARLRARIGLHTGEAAVSDGRYVGLSVHRAARVCAAALGDQVLLSHATASVLEDGDLGQLRLRMVGRRRLKDFEQPVGLYQLEGPGLATKFTRPKPEARGRPTWRVGAIAVALVAAVSVAVGIAMTRDSRPHGLSQVARNSVGVIDPDRNTLVDEIGVGGRPTRITIGDGSVWVVNDGDNTVSHIDSETRAVAKTLPFQGSDGTIAASGNRLWIASYELVPGKAGPRLLNPARLRVALERVEATYYTRVPIATGDRGIYREFLTFPPPVAATRTDVWAAVFGGLVHVDPETSVVTPLVSDLTSLVDIAVGEDSVWFIPWGTSGGGAYYFAFRMDMETRSVTEVRLPGVPSAIAVGEGAVWVALASGNVVRIEPELLTISATIDVGPSPSPPTDLAVGEGSLWLANSAPPSISRIDVETNEVVATIPLGNRPEGIAVGDGAVWVSVS